MIIDPQNSDHLILSVGPVGVYESYEMGSSWQGMNNGFPEFVKALNLEVDPMDPNTYYAGTRGHGFCTYTKVSTGVEEEEFSIFPTDLSLSQNFPNPFNSTTSIQYSLTTNQSLPHVTLKIYNLLGREVRTLVDEPKEIGYYTVTWDGKDDSGREGGSGIYFYRLTRSDFTDTKRMLFLKYCFASVKMGQIEVKRSLWLFSEMFTFGGIRKESNHGQSEAKVYSATEV